MLIQPGNKMKLIQSLKIKYFSFPVSVRAALWFTICNLVQRSVAMITLPIFTRLLTTEQYGVFTVYQSWYNIISIIVTLNLAGSVINNGMVKYANERDKFISSMQGLSITVTGVFFVIYLCAMSFFNKMLNLSSIFVLTMFVQLLFEPAYLMWSQRQRYEYKYKTLLLATAIVAFFSPVLGVIAVISTEYKSEARVISFALVQICVGLFFFILQMIKGKSFFNKEIWKFALVFNLPLIPHYLSQIVLGQSDRIMIERMIGKPEAAMYGVVYNLATVITILLNAINSSFVPALYKNIEEKSYKAIKSTSNLLFLFMGAFVCLFMLFGPELIFIFLAPEYKDAKWIFPPVVASIYFTFVYVIIINIEFYFEKTKYVMVVSVLGAIANILLNLFFIKKYGYIAAGYTTVACYILFAVGHYLLYKFIAKKKDINESLFDGKRITLYGGLVMVANLVCVLLYNYNIVRYALIGIVGIILLINYKKLISIVKKVMSK